MKCPNCDNQDYILGEVCSDCGYAEPERAEDEDIENSPQGE